MRVFNHPDGGWYIRHGRGIIDQTFNSEDEAYLWANENIDDQVFDGPNTLCPPLKYMHEGTKH